jgi:hypothetical protein
MTHCTGDTVTEVSRGVARYAAYNKVLNELREATRGREIGIEAKYAVEGRGVASVSQDTTSILWV